jgi:phosphate-selective porin
MFKYTERSLHGGVQRLYRFDNGWGASVIRHSGSYGSDRGLWELAVIRYLGEDDRFRLNYTTPVTDDVIGHLTDDDVEKLLLQISEL